MGKVLIMVVLGVFLLFVTISAMINQSRIDLAESNFKNIKYALSRNCATSGAYMALSKLSFDEDWIAGFQNLVLNGSNCNVVIQDNNTNAALSSMERIITSTGTYQDLTKTVNVHIGIPPDLANLAGYSTGPAVNLSVLDESGNPDPSLIIDNAPFMVPYDFNALDSLAEAQGHVIDGDFSPSNTYPNGDFYYDGVNPNVTVINGDLQIGGGRTVYGIFVVYGDARVEGSARVEGVITLPNPGTMIIHGGGDPSEASITGGIFANGTVDGTGNHIDLQYDSEYMSAFAEYQVQVKLFVITWNESPSV